MNNLLGLSRIESNPGDDLEFQMVVCWSKQMTLKAEV